jgi:hypothetical protein
MASERDAVFSAAHFSMRPIKSSEMRTPYSGSVPVAGLPGFLRLTDIDFDIIAYNVKASRGEASQLPRPGSNRCQGGQSSGKG